MQVIYGDASNIKLTAQKRLVRVTYGQTQVTPYACYLGPSLRNADGSIRIPKATDTEPLARSAEAFTLQGSLPPGLVLVRESNSENVVIATGAAAEIQPFGLLGQWVGGTLDGVKNTNEVSAWRGPDAILDLLSPAWNDEGVSAALSAAKAGTRVSLYGGTDGRLTVTKAAGAVPVAEIIERPSSAVLRISLLI